MNIQTVAKRAPRRKKIVQTLGEFIEAEIRKRRMSARQFSKLSGIANSSISAYIRGEDIKLSTRTLQKLSKVTGVAMETLIEMASPGAVRPDIPTDVLLLAQELTALRKNHKAIYDVIITIMRSKTSADDGK